MFYKPIKERVMDKKMLDDFKKQLEHTKEVLSKYEKQSETFQNIFNKTLEGLPDEYKGIADEVKAKVKRIIIKAKNGDMSHLEEMENLKAKIKDLQKDGGKNQK